MLVLVLVCKHVYTLTCSHFRMRFSSLSLCGELFQVVKTQHHQKSEFYYLKWCKNMEGGSADANMEHERKRGGTKQINKSKTSRLSRIWKCFCPLREFYKGSSGELLLFARYVASLFKFILHHGTVFFFIMIINIICICACNVNVCIIPVYAIHYFTLLSLLYPVLYLNKHTYLCFSLLFFYTRCLLYSNICVCVCVSTFFVYILVLIRENNIPVTTLQNGLDGRLLGNILIVA